MFQISHIQNKGRGLIAKQDIPTSTSILKEEALIKIPDKESNCWQCLEKMGELVCSACKVARYCSKLHQKEDWRNAHKQECGFIANSKQPSIPQSIRGVYRLSLVKHDLCASIVHEKETHIIASLIAKYSGMPYHELVAVGYKFASNAIGIMNSFGDGIGTGIYPIASLMNHSCKPNAILSFQAKGSLSVSSTTEIKKGQEICISYCETVQPCEIRRRDLKDRYGFFCDCDLCCEPIDKFLGVSCPICSKVVNINENRAIGCDCSFDFAEISSLISQAQGFHDRKRWDKVVDLLHGKVAASHCLLFNALSLWQDQELHAKIKKWDVIERITELYIPCLETVFEGNPVALGTEYLKYAKLLILKDPVPKKADWTLQKALEILSKVLGEGHPMVCEALEMRSDLERYVAAGGLLEE